ncbi:MAG: hypothetical protein J6Y78_07970 [Paludibacteraceae bacterium]|nr:hypothetical protein [Paludibacteraceae bacterium]
MVQRWYVECPTCGKRYQIKILIDQNIGIYEWPINFECLDCGENIDYTFSGKGLCPKESNFLPSPSDAPITTIGYSSSLPITDNLYMKDLDYEQSKVLFSPFLNLTFSGGFIITEVHQFDLFLQRMQENLLPYKDVLLSLMPIFKKGNFDAFSKKMALLFGIKKRYKSLTSSKDMYDAYFELIDKSYHNLVTPYYDEHYFKRNVKPLSDYLNGASLTDVKAIKEKLDKSGKISTWYKDEAIPYIAEAMNKIQKLIPAMIYSSVGESNVAKRGDLKIVTISCSEVASMYSKGFETYTHALKIMVGLNNIVENGDIDKFTNPKVGGVDTIDEFARLTGGKMLEHLENYTTIYDYLDGAMNNKVRNADIHGGVEYLALTQEVKCYYDDSDRSKHYDTSLIAICRMCYVQLLHIIEVTLLARKIVEKVN